MLTPELEREREQELARDKGLKRHGQRQMSMVLREAMGGSWGVMQNPTLIGMQQAIPGP